MKTTTTTQSTAGIAPGARVRVGGTITALVTGHTIRQDAAGKLYLSAVEVTWWEGSERFCFDVHPCEVTPADDEDTTRIGF